MSWPRVKLGDLLVANYGKALKVENRVQSGQHDVFGSNGYVGKHSGTLIEEPTIIIGRKGSVGAITFAPSGGWTIDTAYYVTLKQEVDLRFLFYALKNSGLESLAITTSIPGLNRDSLYRVEIPLPPLEEQKRLAAILDRADELRCVRRSTLERLDELAQSLFLELFGDPATNPKGWEVEPIEYVLDRIIDYRGKSPEKTSDGIPLITARVIKNGRILPPGEYISPKDYDSWMTRGLPKAGDVIFTTEAPMGEVAQLDGSKVALAQRVLVLRGKENLLNNTFLREVLRTDPTKEQLRRRSTGSTVLGIRQKEFRKVTIPLPPLTLQQKFAEQIEELETIKSRARASLTELDALFASLQARAFAGEL